MIQFEIPGLPPIISNSRGNWRKRHADNKKWARFVYEALLLSRQLPDKPFSRAVLHCARFSSVSPDYDGLVISFKCIIDALVDCRVLANDKFENIGAPNYTWEKCKKNQGHIKVTVEPIIEIA